MSAEHDNHRRYAFGEFVIECDRGSLSRNGAEVQLRPKSFAVLCYLVANGGRLVTKSELMEAVWGQVVVTEGSLTQCIVDVRRALGSDGRQIIRTVPRRGFIFEYPVSSQQPATEEPSIVMRTAITGAAPEFRPQTSPGVDALPRTERRRWRALALVGLWLLGVAGGGLWMMNYSRGDPGAAEARAGPAVIPSNSIAVLRFLDLSPDQSQAYLADGLGEEILHLLAQSPHLRVIARSSSFAFEPGEVDIPTIAAQLGVGYMLEGSVRREGGQLRISAQLIDASTSTHVWSRSYDRASGDLLTLQREIATDVARALTVTLTSESASASPPNPKAEDRFLLARYMYNRRAAGDLVAAEKYLRQAVESDPGHARAWTLLAGILWLRSLEDPADRDERLEEMHNSLQRALDLDPMLAEAHLRMSMYHSRVRQDRGAAEESFARAVELAPNDPLVLGFRSVRAVRDGRLDEALEFSRRVVAADPLSSVRRSYLGQLLLLVGRFDESLAELYRARELSPDSGLNFDISRALLLQGRVDEARREARALETGLHRDQLRVLLDADDTALARLESDDSAHSMTLLAEIDAFRGDVEAAFTRLAALSGRIRQAGPLDRYQLEAMEIETSPFLGSLHQDARWAALLAQLR